MIDKGKFPIKLIADVCVHIIDLNVEPEAMSRETFPLPQNLSERLRGISQACHDGRGFAVLRGLKPGTLTEEENVLVVAGVSSYVAPLRGFQDFGRERVTCKSAREETCNKSNKNRKFFKLTVALRPCHQ